ncbi:erythromycin esterase family protein [Pedobacter metabolipauper]|uniref:Erythromycin esterase n=1 Tax=Pedobacter metabolipauper TaxID=425513 RepID=A0A4R6SZ30_9SPHI|nr:erythromycin esterase family protein [Pedobacter metabolipauper]TDQ11884.1 erythromycin esterase [Pedobacter metabolipauper]
MKHLCQSTTWKNISTSLTALLLMTFTVSAQDASLEWVNKNSHEIIQADSAVGQSDLSFLKREVSGKHIVGLGEASHGTHEFYMQKAHMISYLIQNCGFRSVAFEVPKSMMEPVDLYVQTGQGNLKDLMKGWGLYHTEEIYLLFQKLSQYNRGKTKNDRVKLVGFDNPDYWSNPFTRDKFMADNVIRFVPGKKNKIILWAHNVHLSKDTTAEYWPMGGHLKKHFGNQFFSIALDTYSGTANVLNNGKFEPHAFQTSDSTLSGTLSKARYPRFFLSFNSKSNPFKGAVSLITNIYSNWQEPKPIPIRPGEDFDAVIFIKETTPSVELK